jgi:hypothetical protein
VVLRERMNTFFHFHLLQEEYGPDQLGIMKVSGIATDRFSLAVGNLHWHFVVWECPLNHVDDHFLSLELGAGKARSKST